MKNISLIFLIILIFGCNSDKAESLESISNDKIIEVKESTTDSLIQPKGTQIFFGSNKLNDLRWESGYILSNLEFTPCDDKTGEISITKKGVTEIIKTDTSCTVELMIVGNCCHDFLCEADMFDEQTLNLIYHSYGSNCSCNCCFGLNYHFEILPDYPENSIIYNDIQYIIVNGDTTNKIQFSNFPI